MTPRRRHALLVVASLLSLAPFFWMLWASLKRPGFGTGLEVLGPRTESYGPFTVPPGGSFLRFETFEPGASQVAVAGTFSAWNPLPLASMGAGRFRGDVVAEPGFHEYKLVVDGQWRPDPANPAPPDSSGGNSVILLKGRMAVSHSGVLDRSIWSEGKLLPIVVAPGAIGVRVLREGHPPLPLLPGVDSPDVSGVPDGPKGEMLRPSESFSIPSGVGVELSPYRIEVERSLAARIAALYTFDNYREVLTDESFPFGRFFMNSLVVAGLAAFLTTLLCTLGGYAFATKEFPGKERLFQLCMASMMVPGMIYMVPQYAVVTRIGWIDSYWGMVVPHLANVFGLLLMTNFIRGIPKSLFEAADVDGASEFMKVRHVLMPLASPAMATLFVMTFMGQWSNFLWQLITNTPSSPYRTLPVGLALFKGQYDLKVEAMMAAATFSVVPVSIVFLLSQKKLIAGLTSGSVKE